MNEILNGNFLETLVTLVIQILTILTNIILYPINLLIDTVFPDISSALDSITALFTVAKTYIGWAISFMGIPAIILSMVVAYYLFVITTTLGIWGVKLAIKWIGHFA